ncbi:MAG: winged helix-turn-helix transcriptional regulator [Anaerolineae bacterium]|nr:winged helix-turn-helix transcriptional regulator [Anaerolineae bacterium]
MENEFKATAADLTILENIESEPDTTQASLAEMMGVAVGTINWHLKRLIDKGYVKVKRAERKKLRYIITPEGIALRTRLLVDFIQSSMELYRLVRGRSQHAISEIKSRGHKTVRIEGEGDVAEILKLTCMEQGIAISRNHHDPTLKVIGLKIFIEEKE